MALTPSLPISGSITTGSLIFSPSYVSAPNSTHTVSASYTISTGSYLKLAYYTQVSIPTVCELTSGNGECYSYPSTNTIIIRINATQSSPYSFSLAGMTNPYQYSYGSSTFHFQIWQGGTVTQQHYTNYYTSVITTDPTTSNTLTVSFTPTLTPNYHLKYGFWNIAKLTITHLLQNEHIQRIRIDAPGEVTLDTEYCNITMESVGMEAAPYPIRMTCQERWSYRVYVTLNSDHPTWQSNFTQREVYVYLRYTINDAQFTTSNNWYVYTYSSLTTNTNDRISQASGSFPIQEFQSPYLYVLNFPTKSFNARTCAINEQCMFYGFIYPTTPISDIAITRMTFGLPREFKYTSEQVFDSCTVQSRTTDLRVFSCGVSRTQSQVTVEYVPPAYNQEYNLLSIDTANSASLFTAPAHPGDHYTMHVNLWSATDHLVESQAVNVTTVFAHKLAVPNISFTMPLDGGTKGMFELEFLVGTADILPAHASTVSNSITSAIELIFPNTFDASLGTGLAEGEEVARLAISGLSFST